MKYLKAGLFLLKPPMVRLPALLPIILLLLRLYSLHWICLPMIKAYKNASFYNDEFFLQKWMVIQNHLIKMEFTFESNYAANLRMFSYNNGDSDVTCTSYSLCSPRRNRFIYHRRNYFNVRFR